MAQRKAGNSSRAAYMREWRKRRQKAARRREWEEGILLEYCLEIVRLRKIAHQDTRLWLNRMAEANPSLPQHS